MGFWKSIFWPMGVDFLPLGVDCESMGVDFETLCKLMLGIWEPNWDQLESILAARGKIRLLSFEYRPLGVNYGPLGVNFLRL